MAAAIPTVLRVNSLDPDDPRPAGPPAGCGPPPIPGCGPLAPALIPAVAAAPAPTSPVATAAPGASAPVPAGAGRGIAWVPPGAIRPRARANSRTTHRLAAPSRSLARARVLATDWMAP